MPRINVGSCFIAGECGLNILFLLNSLKRQDRIALYYVQIKMSVRTDLVWFAGSNNVLNLKSISFPLLVIFIKYCSLYFFLFCNIL